MVTERLARELASFEYTSSGTSTSTATHGAALTSTWGGNFTVAEIGDIEIELNVPFLQSSAGGLANYSVIHLIVDSVCQSERLRGSYNATVPAFSGGGENLRIRLHSQMAGAHNVAVQLQSDSSSHTATIAAGANNIGLLTVRELG